MPKLPKTRKFKIRANSTGKFQIFDGMLFSLDGRKPHGFVFDTNPLGHTMMLFTPVAQRKLMRTLSQFDIEFLDKDNPVTEDEFLYALAYASSANPALQELLDDMARQD